MRVAITGGTGFIGPYMIQALVREGHEVIALARPGREDAVWRPEDRPARVEIHTGDLIRADSLTGFLDGVEILIHMAAAHDHIDDDTMQKITVGGTRHLLAEAERAYPEHVKQGEGLMQFFIMSSAVIGAPVYSYYRDAKRVQEKIVRGANFPWASFRPTLVYGVGDMRHTAPLLRKCAAQKGRFLIPHQGKSKINPVHVEDVADAVLKYFDFDRGVDCAYELAGPSGISYNQFIDYTIAAAGGKLKRRNIPKKWIDRGLFIAGLFGKDTTQYRRASAYFTLHHEHDISNAEHELGWVPRTYEEGIKQVAQGDWWRE